MVYVHTGNFICTHIKTHVADTVMRLLPTTSDFFTYYWETALITSHLFPLQSDTSDKKRPSASVTGLATKGVFCRWVTSLIADIT